MQPTDEELAREAKKGSVEAVGQLYDRHRPQIFRFVWSRLSHRQLAEDVTAEVFTRMVKSLPDYQFLNLPFQAWLYRIARNLIIDHYRRDGQRDTVSLDEVQYQLTMEKENPVTLVEQKLAWEQIQSALVEIDEAQQEVLILRFLVGLSLKEVAQTMDRTVASVKTLQHRGLIALRATLMMMSN